MVVKIYVSGISGNKEVKKRQQRVLMILDSKNVEYELIDITEPGKEDEKEFMQTNGLPKESKYPLPPQIFNEESYCGDYEDFDLANEMDELEEFLKVAPPGTKAESKEIQENGNTTSRETSTEKDAAPAQPDSLQERTEAPTEVVKEEESKTEEEEEEEAKEAKEPTPEDAEKAEEKSDDQEKEE